MQTKQNTIKNRSKFAALHPHWVCLQMSEKFSSGMKNYKKNFLIYFLTKNFRGKVDVNYKSLNKIDLVFKLKFEYFGLYLEMNITDPNFLMLYFKNVCNN